jgi:hypothetical protein
MAKQELYMLLLGCKPAGRHTEQHDIFFCVAESLAATIPQMKAFWPDAGSIHLDAWRKVTQADGYRIEVVPAINALRGNSSGLFFINLGGYKPGEFEEYHYKMVVAAPDKASAVKSAKATAFYRHTGFKGATSHIDDKYGIDVDDVYDIADILSRDTREKWSLQITPEEAPADDWHIGYTKLSTLLTP